MNLSLDAIFAFALSKTLTKVSSPATVGLYSSCQDRINRILRQVEGMFLSTSQSDGLLDICRYVCVLNNHMQ